MSKFYYRFGIQIVALLEFTKESVIHNYFSRVEYDDDMYKIHVKVENFKPEELIVKTVDNTVQVKP